MKKTRTFLLIAAIMAVNLCACGGGGVGALEAETQPSGMNAAMATTAVESEAPDATLAGHVVQDMTGIPEDPDIIDQVDEAPEEEPAPEEEEAELPEERTEEDVSPLDFEEEVEEWITESDRPGSTNMVFLLPEMLRHFWGMGQASLWVNLPDSAHPGFVWDNGQAVRKVEFKSSEDGPYFFDYAKVVCRIDNDEYTVVIDMSGARMADGKIIVRLNRCSCAIPDTMPARIMKAVIEVERWAASSCD